jgi:hypothetical protein
VLASVAMSHSTPGSAGGIDAKHVELEAHADVLTQDPPPAPPLPPVSLAGGVPLRGGLIDCVECGYWQMARGQEICRVCVCVRERERERESSIYSSIYRNRFYKTWKCFG